MTADSFRHLQQIQWADEMSDILLNIVLLFKDVNKLCQYLHNK